MSDRPNPVETAKRLRGRLKSAAKQRGPLLLNTNHEYSVVHAALGLLVDSLEFQEAVRPDRDVRGA